MKTLLAVTMKTKIALAAVMAFTLAIEPTSANENALGATVTRAERVPYTGFVEFLMVVDNKSNRGYPETDWSCVFFDGHYASI